MGHSIFFDGAPFIIVTQLISSVSIKSVVSNARDVRNYEITSKTNVESKLRNSLVIPGVVLSQT